MDRIEQKLDEMEQRLSSRINQRSSRVTFLQLVLALVLAMLMVSAWFANRYISTIDNKLTKLESTVKPLAVAETRTKQLQPASDAAIASLSARLTALETLQEAMTSTSKGALEQMNFVFATLAAFFTVFSGFFAYRQFSAESNREAQDQEMRSLVRSFQDNIITISSLISTLEQTIDYRKQIQDQLGLLHDRAKALEGYKAESDTVLLRLLSDLNSEAIRIFPLEIDRANLSLEENRRKMEAFANKMTSAERIRNVEDDLNPFCYYIRGLSNVSIYQYELAINDFKLAYRKGRADMAEPKFQNYAEQDRENVREFVSKMLVSCSYFQGLGYKNLGKYPESREKFQEALDRDPTHLQSRTYLLQVMFFDLTVPFEVIEKEYDRVTQDFEALRKSTIDEDALNKAFILLKINQGDLYLKKRISPPFRSEYQQYENPSKAIKYYWEAFNVLKSDLAMFSVALAMEDVGRTEWGRHTPQEFYQEVMNMVKKRVAADPDRLYSVMLYYMLAICARKLNIGGDSSEVFLSQARDSLKQVPSHITCFSPVSRIRLSRTQILEEMEVFERTFK